MPRAKRKGKNSGTAKKSNGESLVMPKAPASELSQSITSSPLVRRFMDEVERLAEDFGMGRGLLSTIERGLPGAGWSPQVEMLERDGELVVRA
ncbi:MAG: hypothetical protein ACMG6H_15140 [Acidobacteriota bacterium]